MKHDWEYKKVGEICNVKTGKLDANASSPEGKYPFFTCSKEILHIDSYSYDEECVLIAGNGDLNVKYFKGKFDAYQRTYIVTLKDKNEVLSVPYLYHFFSKYIEHLRKVSIGGIIKYIKLNNLTDAEFPVPPLPVQQQIVDELDKLSEIIEKKKQQVKELDNLAQAIFYDMFGDPVENEKGWEVKKLGDCGMVSSGGTPSRTKPHYFTGKINWYSAGELNKLYLSESVEKITEEAIAESSAKLFPANSLFIGMYDTAAFKLGITRESASSNQACANFFSESMHLVYLYYLLLFIKHKVLNDRHGARQKNLSVGYIKGLKLPIAPLPLQQSFAQKIEAIEKQKELINQSIKETQTLFDARMDYYFGE